MIETQEVIAGTRIAPRGHEDSRWACDLNRCFRFEVRIARGEQSGHVSRIVGLKGVRSQGDTLEAVLENTKEALIASLQSYLDNNQEIPIHDDDDPLLQDERAFWVVVNV